MKKAVAAVFIIAILLGQMQMEITAETVQAYEFIKKTWIDTNEIVNVTVDQVYHCVTYGENGLSLTYGTLETSGGTLTYHHNEEINVIRTDGEETANDCLIDPSENLVDFEFFYEFDEQGNPSSWILKTKDAAYDRKYRFINQ